MLSILPGKEDAPFVYDGLVKVQPFSVLLVIILGTVTVHHWLRSQRKAAKFPLFNPAKGIEVTDMARRWDFVVNGPQILRDAEAANPGRPFNIMTGSGEMTILPPDLAQELRGHPDLSFLQYFALDFNGHLPGFETFKALGDEKLVLAVISKHITKNLSRCITLQSSEASHAVHINFGSSTEWQPVVAYEKMHDMVARMTARMFLGEELCRDPDWLDVIKNYTYAAFTTAAVLRAYPSWLRPLMNLVLPQCRELRVLTARSKSIVAPVFRKRAEVCEEAVRRGDPVPYFDDAISWFQEERADPSLDPAVLQLVLSVPAIHTATDLLAETLLHLAQRPQLVEELRAEISTVLKTQGWRKQSFTSMKLLDSVLKETQRLKPILTISMERIAMADVRLSTGDVIPKGAVVSSSVSSHRDAKTYEDPNTFKADRFVRWRGTERDSDAHLVSTSTASMGFGHGRHACPGRFFAALEMKIALCHMLIKYDWMLVPGECTVPASYGFSQFANPTAKVMVRRRTKMDLDIDNLL